MSERLSANTQAILLLTQPLGIGRGRAGGADFVKPLTLVQYGELARLLGNIEREPADLLGCDAGAVLDESFGPPLVDSQGPDAERVATDVIPDESGGGVDLPSRRPGPALSIDRSRLERLLERGAQLALAVERWQSRAVWVLSRADADYPRRLKRRLGQKAPPVLYGCGERAGLDEGGLAVVGPRKSPDDLLSYAASVGELAAQAERTVVSGAARGVDRAAMNGALEVSGRAVGVLASDLLRLATNRQHREPLMSGRLTLISAYDPSARFQVWSAMERNHHIYALADAALVVDALVGKGGTWTGAVDALKGAFGARVFVRTALGESEGLAALRKRGAAPWPEPGNAEGLQAVLGVDASGGGEGFESVRPDSPRSGEDGQETVEGGSRQRELFGGTSDS